MGVSGDYLWDRTGSDPEVERLEALLRPLALKPRAAPRRLRPAAVFAAAAALLVAALLFFSMRTEEKWDQREVIEFKLGRFQIQPGSKVRVLRESDDLVKLRLQQGQVAASISAKARPELFQVETPATTCVDLGCQYTLEVDERGRSRVYVFTGRVAFRDGARDLYVPATAFCASSPGRPGTPVWEDAPAGMLAAVQAFDEAPRTARAAAARKVASFAKEGRDSLPLWHLLQDADPEVRAAGLDGLLQSWAEPDGVAREAVLRGERAALEKWRDHVKSEWNWELPGEKK